MLGYLVLTARPHRRDRLCEMFWEIPDDPRGSLRWSLSKIRPLVNELDNERLVADRERASLTTEGIEIDVHRISQALDDKTTSASNLKWCHQQLKEPLLDGTELPNQHIYQQWLTAERAEMDRLRGKLLSRLASHPDIDPLEQLQWAEAWETLEPYTPAAATCLLSRLSALGQLQELEQCQAKLVKRFRNAGISWSSDAYKSSDVKKESSHAPPPFVASKVANTSETSSNSDQILTAENIREESTNQESSNQESTNQERSTAATSIAYDTDAQKTRRRQRELLARQKIQFCTAEDGVRIAYATIGEGTPIVKAANWLSHLEHDWDSPIWSPLFRELATDHQFIRYDERGNGLSDWEVDTISFESFVTDLETVVDASGVDRFALLGISQGAAVSIEYAIRYPERVSHLILFGGYAAGWRIGASEATIKEREAVMTLTSTGWGQDNPAYRQIFSSTFMPSANAQELAWFNEFQRLTTSPENAVRFLSVFGDIDVRHQLSKVQVPTLVIHSMGDLRIPVATGRDIAATIPNAEFVGLDSDGHLLLGREPASDLFVETVREFLSRTD
ncbi:hypothetical protein GCM10007877_01790 [Marinibactrum halimedae]|uniref:AB hydrolase-1 domain-containing protein n=1 Tax=Marinibactrum halimedae TaxID=1444977 RepID=A0AA37WJV6_9GAMM|nr:hypothetical protein GCM10007877_01790 [Marinibactrum halimedae]